jgi:hypothetical protein
MQEHIHTGPVQWVVTGIGVILFLNVWRIGAAYLVTKPQTEWLGRAMGALITFSTENVGDTVA